MARCDLQVQSSLDYFTESVLGIWEESLKSVVRETFANATRVANGFFSWWRALLVTRDSKKSSQSRPQAWKAWWQEDRQSSLNAFIASHSPSARRRQSCELDVSSKCRVRICRQIDTSIHIAMSSIYFKTSDREKQRSVPGNPTASGCDAMTFRTIA